MFNLSKRDESNGPTSIGSVDATAVSAVEAQQVCDLLRVLAAISAI